MPSKGKKIASKQNSLRKKKRASKHTIQQFIQPNVTANDIDENQIDAADTTYTVETPLTETKNAVQKNPTTSSSQEALHYPYLLRELLQIGIISSIIIIILGITYTII